TSGRLTEVGPPLIELCDANGAADCVVGQSVGRVDVLAKYVVVAGVDDVVTVVVARENRCGLKCDRIEGVERSAYVCDCTGCGHNGHDMSGRRSPGRCGAGVQTVQDAAVKIQ